MIDRQRELDTLQLAVATVLEPLGKIRLATPYKSLRRVTVTHPSGASVRLIISGEFRGKSYLISVLKIVDDFNSKVAQLDNFTMRGVNAADPELSSLFTRVKESLEALAELRC